MIFITYFHLKFHLQVTECVTYANNYTLLVKGKEGATESYYGEKETACAKYLDTLNTYCLYGNGLMKLRLAQDDNRRSQYQYKLRIIKKTIHLTSIKKCISKSRVGYYFCNLASKNVLSFLQRSIRLFQNRHVYRQYYYNS